VQGLGAETRLRHISRPAFAHDGPAPHGSGPFAFLRAGAIQYGFSTSTRDWRRRYWLPAAFRPDPADWGASGAEEPAAARPAFHKKKPRLAAGSGPSWFVVGPVVRLHCRYAVQSAAGPARRRHFPHGGHAHLFLPFTFSAPEGGRFVRGAASAFRGAASIDPVGPVPSIPNLRKKETTCVPSPAKFFIINSL
jgi:hypothetical protein